MANTLCLKRSIENIIIPKIESISRTLLQLSTQWYNVYMMSKTHGQSAVTTSMGKEIMVYQTRLLIQLEKLRNVEYSSKFGGAVGNLNAHYFCYPELNWDTIMDDFLNEKFDVKRNKYTTR